MTAGPVGSPGAASGSPGNPAPAPGAHQPPSPDLDRVIRTYTGFQLFFSLLFWLPVFYEFQKRIGLGDPEIFRIQSLYYVAFCVLEIPTGMIADHLGYRRCLRAGAFTLVLANLLPPLSPDYPGMLGHFLLIALARSFVSGASSAYLYEFLRGHGAADRYKEVEGRARALGLYAKVVCWTAVGSLMEWRLSAPYWLTVGAALVSFGYAWSLPRVGEGEGSQPRPSVAARIRGSFATVLGSPLLIVVILQGVAIFVMARICQVNLFQPILETKRFDVATYGMVMSGMTVFEAIGSSRSTWLRRWMGDFMAVFFLTLVIAASLVLLPFAGKAGTLVLLCLFSASTGLCFPIQRQVLNDVIPDPGQRATILSIESIVDRAANAWLASLIGGYLATGRLVEYLWLSSGLTVLLMGILLVLSRRIRDTAAAGPAEGPRSAPPVR